MNLLFLSSRHRYPGETVPWNEYFGEWLAHPFLAAMALLCVIWMFARFYAVWKSRREEREEQEQQRERWGESVQMEKNPPAEKERKPEESAVPFEERNRPVAKYEWRLFPLLFVMGFVFGMGGSSGAFISGDDLLLLLLVAVLMVVLFVAKSRPANWAYTSFEEDRRKKRHINWKAVAKGLLPYGLVFVAGLAFGLVQGWLIGK